MEKTQIYFFLEELNSINIPLLKKLKNISIIYRNYSKQNYIDPRIIFSYSKRENINIEKLMPNSLINKYNWAYSVDSNFIF